MKKFTQCKAKYPSYNMPGHTRIRDYAKSKGVSRQWVYDLMRRGKIQGIRISGVLYIFTGKEEVK